MAPTCGEIGGVPRRAFVRIVQWSGGWGVECVGACLHAQGTREVHLQYVSAGSRYGEWGFAVVVGGTWESAETRGRERARIFVRPAPQNLDSNSSSFSHVAHSPSGRQGHITSHFSYHHLTLHSSRAHTCRRVVARAPGLFISTLFPRARPFVLRAQPLPSGLMSFTRRRSSPRAGRAWRPPAT